MLINFDLEFKNLDGKVSTNADNKAFTLREACINALLASQKITEKGPKPIVLPGLQRLERSKLARRIYKSKGPIEMKLDDLVKIKKLIEETNPSILLYTQVCEAFDPPKETNED